jgi:tetratricopeptide (TPR) repeat protein
MTGNSETLAAALAHHRSGDLARAEPLYRAILRDDPYHVNALQLLGLVLYQTGRVEEAIRCLRQALQLNPGFAEVHNNLSNILTAQGRLDEAIAGFREAIRLKPAYAEAHNNLGAALQQLGRFAEADACFREALRLRPDYAEARANLASLPLPYAGGQSSEVAKASELSQAGGALDQAEHWNNQGIAQHNQGRWDDAAACFLEAIRQRPTFAQAHSNLGVVLLKQGKLREALASCEQAVRLDPAFADGHNNVGVARQRLGDVEAAAAAYERAIRLRPDYAEAHNNLGCMYERLERFEEAAASFHEALHLRPDYADAQKNLGVLAKAQGRLDEAAEIYRAVLRRHPRHAETHAALGMLHLLRGDFRLGGPEYEWRLRCESFRPPQIAELRTPAWEGASLEGRTIFLCPEQGQGDTLQFIRYAALIKARGATVVAGCAPELHELLSTCAGIDYLVKELPPPIPCDCHAMLLSLPRLLGTTLQTIPSQVPYLAASPEKREFWRREFAGKGRMKIGIAWQGNPQNGINRQRSVWLEQFEPLAQVPGVTLFSLQKGPAADPLPPVAARLGLIDLAPRLVTWADTAAAICELDLTVSIDTAVAHLAGAVAAPVWVPLHHVPDWRWLMDREDCPWYPTMRLYRQSRPGEWESVFASIVRDLHREVPTGRASRC